MCRLFGFRSAAPSRAHRSLVEAENAVALQATGHPDGWGIGWFVGDEAFVVKSSEAAHACERFRHVSTRLTSHTFVVHVRKATVGAVDHLNAHPFRFGRWLFAHNGTLYGFDRLRPWVDARTRPTFLPIVMGDTDSERLFFYLLSHLERCGLDGTGREAPSASGVGAAVREALAALDAHARELRVDRPITNVLLTDGRCFVAHRAGMPLFLATQKHTCADEPTCTVQSKVCLHPARPLDGAVNHLLVASEPLDEHENVWETVPDGATVVLHADFRLEVVAPAHGWLAPELPEHAQTYRSAS